MKKYYYYVAKDNYFNIYNPHDEWVTTVYTLAEVKRLTAFLNDDPEVGEILSSGVYII